VLNAPWSKYQILVPLHAPSSTSEAHYAFANSSSMAKSNKYRFHFELEHTRSHRDEDEMYVVGSEEALGNWNQESAVKLEWTRANIWTLCDALLPDSFQYKYLWKKKTGEKEMEECENRVFRMPPPKPTEKSQGDIVEIRLQDTWNLAPHAEVDISRKQWWKESVVYQIYPRSFKDSNGNGIGDLKGITSKLDYLKDLGIDVIWLSPVYKSPNDDNGYDISDYQDISNEFGTMSDWEEMLGEMHSRGIKLVMDLVVNHTSDEHYWFQQAKSSKDNPYRDYYVWKPPNPTNGKEPNNWASFFGGSCWEYEPQTGEYYLHLFTKKQPDLNWENPQVREEIWNMMKFWLHKGIDGFRMDVINVISKVPNYPDAIEKVKGTYHWGGDFFVNGPRLMEYLKEMKDKVLKSHDILTVGETPFFGVEDACRLTNEEKGVVNMLFHFELMDVDSVPGRDKWHLEPWGLKDIKDTMDGWQVELQSRGWNSLYLENHDQPRSVSRFGNDSPRYRVTSAKMLATWLHMMQGTPYIYQGQEIGMTNVKFDSLEDYKDVETRNAYRHLVTESGQFTHQQMMKAIHAKSRDNARTPVQWDDSRNAGFSSGQPWIQVNPNYKEINIQTESKDPESVLNYYKQLIKIRKKHPVVVYGSYAPLLENHEQIYAYMRIFYEEALLVVANFTSDSPVFTYEGAFECSNHSLLTSNYPVEPTDSLSFTLQPYEARVYLLNPLIRPTQ